MVLLHDVGAEEAVRQEPDAVRRMEAAHVEKVPGEGEHGEALRQIFRRQSLAIAGLGQQKFVPQGFAGIASVEEGRFQNRVGGDGGVDSWGESGNLQPLLEQGIAAVVVGVGMGVEDGGQTPSLGVQNFLNLSSRVLVAAAVNEDSVGAVQFPDSHLGRALDVIGMLRSLNQFVHRDFLFHSLICSAGGSSS